MMKPTPWIATCAALLLTSTAAAQSRHQCKDGEVVVNDGDIVELHINPNKVTEVYFAGPIQMLRAPNWPGMRIKDWGEHISIDTEILPAGIDDLGSFKVTTPSGDVFIALRAASTPGVADERCRVIPRDYRRWDVELNREAGQMCAAQLAGRDREIFSFRTGADQIVEQRVRWALLGRVFSEREIVTIPSEPRDDLLESHVSLRALKWDMQEFLLFEIRNYTDTPYPVAQFAILDGQGRNHAGLVRLNHETSKLNGDVIGIVPPRTVVTGTAEVINRDTLGERVAILISQGDGQRTSVSERVPTWAPAKQVAAESNSQRRSVSLQLELLGGAMWLEDGTANSSLLAATTLTGFSGRLSYGFNRTLAFEFDVAGARSGNARFDNVRIEGTDGELRRNASLARVQIGGALRFGSRVIPSVHANLGLQATSYDSQHVTDSSDTRMPDAPLDVDMTVGFGAGVSLRLSEHITSGVGFSYVDRVNARERTLELGIRIGYAWTTLVAPSPL